MSTFERRPQPEDQIAILLGSDQGVLANRLFNLLACEHPTHIQDYGIVLRCPRDRFESMLNEVAT